MSSDKRNRVRAFVALELPGRVQEALESVVYTAKGDFDALSWVHAERRHVTLAFLGDVDEGTLRRLKPRLLAAASNSRRFTLSLGRVGRFGQRVLYMGVVDDSQELGKVMARVSAAARREGVEVDSAKWHPHVTLARSRRGDDLRHVLTATVPMTSTWEVDEFVLFRSYLGPRPRYEVMHRYALGEDGN